MINWVQNNISALLIGVFTGLLATFVGFILKNLWEIFKISKSKFSGEWEQQIFANNEMIIKESLLKLIYIN